VISIGGNGIYESSFGGNTFVGCYAEEVRGRGYFADTPGQATFCGCFSESQKPTRLAGGGISWLGGSAGGFEGSENALIFEGFSNVHPFEIPNLLNKQIKLMLGYNDNTNALLGWKSNTEDGFFWLFRWLEQFKAWSTESGNAFPGALRVNYQTAVGHARGPSEVSLVGRVSVADPERSRRTCGWGDAAAGERFGFCGALLLMQRPNNRFDPSLRSGLDCAQETGVLPDLVVEVQDASG
jgi:hypothetical protein